MYRTHLHHSSSLNVFSLECYWIRVSSALLSHNTACNQSRGVFWAHLAGTECYPWNKAQLPSSQTRAPVTTEGGVYCAPGVHEGTERFQTCFLLLLSNLSFNLLYSYQEEKWCVSLYWSPLLFWMKDLFFHYVKKILGDFKPCKIYSTWHWKKSGPFYDTFEVYKEKIICDSKSLYHFIFC